MIAEIPSINCSFPLSWWAGWGTSFPSLVRVAGTARRPCLAGFLNNWNHIVIAGKVPPHRVFLLILT